MCMADSGCEAEFNSEKVRKARKQHVCGECWRFIEPGEKYIYGAGKFDGEMYSSKMCLHCKVAANWLSIRCHGYLYGGISEDVGDHLQENVLDDLKEKTWVEHIHNGMCKKWKTESGELMPIPQNFEFPKGV